MVYKVDGNPQLDSCDWSMYSNILNHFIYLDHEQFMKISHRKLKQDVIKPFNQT